MSVKNMTTVQSLAGTWQFRFDDEDTWRELAVPGCWDEAQGRKDLSGPAWYRRRVTLPPLQPEQRAWLLFDAVSYHCEVFVGGHAIGEHTGLWDAFRIEIP
ncbi:MAG TPA: hypothetical protein VFT99_08750, partial [Roseiflexaceae bacterium]|nr:hypothetical protein [Roseiflexaceae bacterium]